MIKGIGSVLFGLCFLMLSSCATAQPNVDRPLDPNMKAGKMFTVRIVPNAKTIDVFVVGAKTAAIDWSEMHMFATIKVGKKRWFVLPGKLEDRFVIDEPTDIPTNSKTQLRLLLDHKQDNEVLEFDLNQKR